MATITMRAFFELDEAIAIQEIQKRNPCGSDTHRGAHASMLKLAEFHNVSEHFEKMADYDRLITSF